AALHSIASSARAISVGGTVRPIILAVCRLTTNSNFVARKTGSLKADGLSELEVNGQQEFRCLLNGQIGGLRSVENLGCVIGASTPYGREICAIGHQPAREDPILIDEHRRQPIGCRHFDDFWHVRNKGWIGPAWLVPHPLALAEMPRPSHMADSRISTAEPAMSATSRLVHPHLNGRSTSHRKARLIVFFSGKTVIGF